MAQVRLTGDWKKFDRVLRRMSEPAVWKRMFDRAAGREAHRLRRLMVQNFNRGGSPKWQPLSEMTIRMRMATGFRGKKPMLRTGDLRNSINVRREGDAWFVGVHRSEKSKTGQSMANLAAIHEFGSKGDFKITVTDKMRRFFLALHVRTRGAWRPGRRRKPPKWIVMPLSPQKSTIVVRIPSRPFILSTWESEERGVTQRILRDIQDQIVAMGR